MAQLPELLEFCDYRGRRNIDDKLDEVITAVNQIIEFLDGEEMEDE